MLLDLLTVAVLAFFGTRLVAAARQSLGGRARVRTLTIVRGLRPRHFLRAPVVLTVVLLVATVLVQVPGLSWGWWTALGGTGNVVVGSTSRTSGTALVWLVPTAFVLLLLPALALLAEREELAFRAGAERWSFMRRLFGGLGFGLAHLVMGIPIGVALALSIGGWYFTWAYLQGFRRGGREPGVLESTRSHLAYNLEVVIGVIAFLIGVVR